ncbi:multidrug transporter [Megasphaera cerevisiae DSM 20462]|jgi:MATE family multidrug resistance protein|uniref:Probable multidrug resistance protein NorM n=1 Tax=Megasphaera cerevisiae DSM 20462 TaxID=1122219 RepID=A0A0J6WV92_9FIRM|nr:MATE family efflux transporter [Megasphaera cerevisiae]KMO87455.1 multidrug transporter [Megasphaera cerevisiae DSM 20462]MCI1750806.1 MATE family efflux transporter [Megasphaera cerevisiae]OKY53789.1 MATE family efflux transporter [Megasphaera cerevisiae]SJZ36727.1 multidrug resistance protein, MATE family [Megasphaera cerevisiae DSM 20462]
MHFPQLYQLRHFLILFAPLLLTQIAQVGTSVFSSIFSGQAGTVDLAGVAVAVNIWYPVFAGVCGIFFGISPIIAQLRGAKKAKRIPTQIMQGLYISIFFTIITLTLGYALLIPFLNIMNLEPAVYAIAKQYLIALSFGILPIFMQATMRYVVDAHGLTHISMAILITNLIITLCLFRLLVFGGLGIAPMGGVGTGYAIMIASWVSFFIFVIILQCKKPFRSYHLWTTFRPVSWIHCLHQLRLGIPIFIAVFCETSLFSIVSLLMSEFGTLYLATNQAAISYATLMYTFPWSVSLAATIIVGYEVGAKNYIAARQYAILCQITAFAIAVITFTATYIFLDPISAVFTSDVHALGAIRCFLLYAMAFTFFDAAGTPVQGVLRGYKDVKIITYVAFITYWLISVPMGYALAHMTSYGPYGYWLGLIISLAINATALNYRLWKHTAFHHV